MSPHQNTRHRAIAVGGFIAAAALLAGCAGTTAAGDTAPTTGGTVNVQFAADPTTFDPALGAAYDDYQAARLMYDTLLRYDDGGALAGGLANEWDAVSAQEYTFTIREGATCADGTAITPSLVADSLTYTLQAKPAVFEGATATFTPDDATSTLAVTLSEPYSPAPQALAKWDTGIICPAGLADPEGMAAGTVEGAESGPYVLASAAPGVGYDFELRTDYDAWPDFAEPLEGVAPDTLHFTIKTDASTTANQLLSGDLNMGVLTGDPADRFQDGDDFHVEQTNQGNVYVIFNQRAGRVFEDESLRVGAAQAIDREAFNDAFTKGRSVVYDTLVPPGSSCAIDDTSILQSYDPAKAASALSGASITMIASNAFGDNAAGAEYITKVLTDAGAEVDLQTSDNSTWGSTLFTAGADWDITILATTNSGRVADELRRIMGTPFEDGGSNLTGAVNPDGQAALEESYALVGGADQCDVLIASQTSALERVDAIPLDGIVQSIITTANVTIQSFDAYTDPATIRVVG